MKTEHSGLEMTVKLTVPGDSDIGIRSVLSALVTIGALKGWELMGLEREKEPTW